ncbi:F420-dependent glucose-6-phosphate dehydrogenase [Methanolobus psychrophilus R15]|nr:F420-dependent glucose-6-phosphate dehydrogenase [Methanolobus psychrophilus R15]
MIKSGYKIGPEQYTPSEMLRQTIAAEENGFDSIDVSDHFHPWSEEGQSCFTWTWLGVGTGEALNEYPVTHEWPEYNKRQEMLAEAIHLIREPWSGEKVSFDGMHYCTQEAKLYTLPGRKI